MQIPFDSDRWGLFEWLGNVFVLCMEWRCERHQVCFPGTPRGHCERKMKGEGGGEKGKAAGGGGMALR